MSLLDAGEFSDWLSAFRTALLENTSMEVPCGSCAGCCASSMFVKIGSSEADTLGVVSEDQLTQTDDGNFMLGFDQEGHCQMFVDGSCDIYPSRPLACRQFDCRIYTAAGLEPTDKKRGRIRQRVREWGFSYSKKESSELHEAVKGTASFILNNAPLFPGGRIPSEPIQTALVAVKSYEALLGEQDDLQVIAKSIVKKNEDFERQRLAKQDP